MFPWHDSARDIHEVPELRCPCVDEVGRSSAIKQGVRLKSYIRCRRGFKESRFIERVRSSFRSSRGIVVDMLATR